MKWLAVFLNITLRIAIFYFLFETLLNPADPRFADKAIPERNFIIVITLSLLFPILYYFKKRWKKYPFWTDSLYLSIFAFDMVGNSFNLYDRFYYFDLLPHFHGSGAVAVAFSSIFGLPILAAAGLASIIHILLEAQEYYTDVLAGTKNVRGTFDVVNDLVVGVIGSFFYLLAAKIIKRQIKDNA